MEKREEMKVEREKKGRENKVRGGKGKEMREEDRRKG